MHIEYIMYILYCKFKPGDINAIQRKCHYYAITYIHYQINMTKS